MNALIMDFKFAFRILRKNPGFALGALIAIALGIGANTAIFSVVYTTLIRSLPYQDAERLVIVWERDINDPKDENVISPGNFSDWKEQNKSFQNMAAFLDDIGHLSGGKGDPAEIIVQYATPNLFSVLGSKAFLGRAFDVGDENSEEPVVVLSHGLWIRRFGGDRQIIGKTIFIDEHKSKILGVMPENFQWFIRKGSMIAKPADLWAPYPITPERRRARGRFMMSVARLKPEATLESAQADMDLVSRRTVQTNPDLNAGWGVRVVPLRQQLAGPVRNALLILSGAVGFVLLIACGNVANLIMVRAMARAREIAVRTALGAGRWRIIRQLLIESLVLAAVGGILGLFLAYWGLEGLRSFLPAYGIDFQAVEVNPIVLIYTLGVSLLTAIVVGLFPAILTTRWNLQEQLKESARGVQLGSGKTRNAFVIAEMALALILLVGAGLLIRSFIRLVSIDPGFNPENVVTVRLLLPESRYPNEARRIQYFQQVIERIQNLPQIKSAGATAFPPFAGPASGTSFTIEGRPDPAKRIDQVTKVHITDSNFFKTLQIPLKEGRTYTQTESIETKRVVVINEALASKYFPNEDPIGKRLKINMGTDHPFTQIIGVVADSKHENLETEAVPTIFWPHSELPYPFMSVIIRIKSDPVSVIPSIRQAILSIDSQQPLGEFRTIEETLGKTYARNQLNMALLFILASVALALSIIGIYGVMSHSVVQRTQEMGIRMALGARSEDLQRMVLKQASKLILIGSLIGLAGALALTRLMQGLLFGTSPTDIGTLTVVTLILIAVALAACFLPAWRASKVDPSIALRYE